MPVLVTLPVGATFFRSKDALEITRSDPVIPLIVFGVGPFCSTVDERTFMPENCSPLIVADTSTDIASTIESTKSE